MNWLLLLYFIEMGFAPHYESLNMLPDSYSYILNENVYYVDLGVEIVIDHFFIGGSAKTFIQPNVDDYEFFPIEVDYLFTVGLRFDNVEIGLKHGCDHPIDSFGTVPPGKSYGSYEEFYIKISNK